jgi:hypothetical protein
MPFPAEDTERLPLRRLPWDCDDDDLAMAPPPGRRAYLDPEDSEKDLLSRWPAGLARRPLTAHNWFHLRLPILLSTTATPLLLAAAAAAASFGWWGLAAAAAAAAADVVVEEEEEASRDWREGRQEEWLASQQAIHSPQEWRRDRLRCRGGGGSWASPPAALAEEEGAAASPPWSSSWKRRRSVVRSAPSSLLPGAAAAAAASVEQEQEQGQGGGGSSGSRWRGRGGGGGGAGGWGWDGEATPIRLVAWSLSRRQAEQKPVKGGSDGCLGHLLPDAASPSPIRIGGGVNWRLDSKPPGDQAAGFELTGEG